MIQEQPDREAFKLTNPPARPKPATFETNTGRQKVLFSGMNCLPGQIDLFKTDGPINEKGHANAE